LPDLQEVNAILHDADDFLPLSFANVRVNVSGAMPRWAAMSRRDIGSETNLPGRRGSRLRQSTRKAVSCSSGVPRPSSSIWSWERFSSSEAKSIISRDMLRLA
jgi:hypothetical protein